MNADERGLKHVRRAPIPVYFRGVLVGEFRRDVPVNDAVIVQVGGRLNDGPKPSFKRFVFSNDREQIRVDPRLSAAGPA